MSEERNNRETGRGKQGYYFHRKMNVYFKQYLLPQNLVLNNILTKNKDKY